MRTSDRIAGCRNRIREIAAQHGATQVRVFGSVARGADNDRSDLDLLVELSPDAGLLELIAIKQDLEDLLDCRVDVVTPASLSPYLREDVLRQAIVL